MSQQTIGVGTSANDGTGDALRTAFQKTNANFTELYGYFSAYGITVTQAANAGAARTVLGLAIGTDVQAYSANLTSYAGVTPSSNVLTLLGAADYAAMRTQLGLVLGTNVQAYDAELAAIAGLTSAADKVPYFTGSGTAALADFTSFGRSLVADANAAAGRATLAAAAASQTTEMIAGFIASPSDKSYKIAVKMAHGGTITETTTISVSGTCTATFKINSTALGGTANSVSSAEQSQSHASNNVFSAGDDIVLTVSSNSSCADMSFSIKYTRTLE